MGLKRVYKIVNTKTGRIVHTCYKKSTCNKLMAGKYNGVYKNGMRKYNVFSNIEFIGRRK